MPAIHMKGNTMNATLEKVLVVLTVSALSLSAFAADKDCTPEPKAKWQAQKEVQASLEKQGYTVKRVKTKGSCYEAKVTDKDGKKTKLVIHPVDGKVVDEEGKA
jgi:hypothetical protein